MSDDDHPMFDEYFFWVVFIAGMLTVILIVVPFVTGLV